MNVPFLGGGEASLTFAQVVIYSFKLQCVCIFILKEMKEISMHVWNLIS